MHWPRSPAIPACSRRTSPRVSSALGAGPVEFSSEGALVVARTQPPETEWLENLPAACQARDLPVSRPTLAQLADREPAFTGAGAWRLAVARRPAGRSRSFAAASGRRPLALWRGAEIRSPCRAYCRRPAIPDARRRTLRPRRSWPTGAQTMPAFFGPASAPLPTGLPAPIP